MQRYRIQYKHTTTLTFYCNDNNKLIGASSITCNDGTWDGGIPQCTRKLISRAFYFPLRLVYMCYLLLILSVLLNPEVYLSDS